MKKYALVTGSSGQDGSYLCKLLLSKKYIVIAADRRSSRNNSYRHKYLNIEDKVIYEDFDLHDIYSIQKLFIKYNFSEVYNLAAQSFVKASFDTPISTAEVTALGVLRVLETIKNISPNTKFYQASTSEMFGKTTGIQNENTKFYPRSPYAVSKLFAHEITKNYRESYNLYACSGILFNHESPLRGEEFVTKKITKQLCEIIKNKRKFLELGNIYSKRDWGHAEDYVRAMWLMLQKKKPQDFVIATSKSISIKDFINKSLNYLNVDFFWKGKGLNEVAINKKNKKIIIKINPKYYRPAEVDYLKGSSNKARKILRWKPKKNIDQLIKEMIDHDLQLV